ncbi:NAD(P)H-hydrate dehydratase [Pseudooceanicola sp. 216_PA32_1]|uniref:Bifunctional NAD(P)H-hydrate repair enzyme n=1 Tax=Pseudooceanicola pacificus TaxID=2676438 RepID=A0A844WAY0_9RHOB|nr:NAD(P)H-hydrate dehydratase [Pseudooceanicola pacificus]MWB77878.1 NAD(P)H-hydrate dehydratase [Pseudooceanicola pacificus]
MTELMTAAQMRATEEAAIAAGRTTGLALMERAGRAVVAAVFQRWPALSEGAHAALVLCGPGNNGGDGFVIARRLRDLGWAVTVQIFGDAARLPPDARRMHDLWAASGPVAPLGPCEGGVDLVVDALFGTGLTRPLPQAVAEAVARPSRGGDQVQRVAVDAPSGLNLDTGAIPGGQGVFLADLTVTFHTAKPGHYLGAGPAVCGQLVCADIGLGGSGGNLAGSPPAAGSLRLAEPVTADTGPGLRVFPGAAIAKLAATGHKYDFGHAVVLAGGVGRGGAGRLAARAALRAGAGLVTMLCPPAALQENAARMDAVMLRACRDAEAFEALVDDRVTALCLGPGLGVGERTRSLVAAVCARRAGARAGRDPAVVLDADALTSFAPAPDALFALLHPRCILTPHEGEFGRLFPDLALSARAGMSKVEAVRHAAARAGCVVLLKGADTVIARPDGAASLHAAVYDRAVPWLATAGAGDVLAGLIAGLAAPASAPELICVAEAAAWLHVEAARAFGPGLIAEDLPDMLPEVFRRVAG